MTARRRALVTGATSDLGAAVVARLRARGVAVIGLARGDTDLRVDLADDALADVLAALPLDDVDVLVHAAAAHPPARRVAATTVDDDRLAWSVGPGALSALARRVAPGMAARGWGRIVAVGSSAGALGGPGQLAYATGKAALVGVVRTLAAELGRAGVTANLVVPGLLATRRTASAVPADVQAHLVAMTAAGRLGDVDEVAAVIDLLCGDDAGYVTGAVIDVDGGLGLGAGLPGRGTRGR